MKASSKGVKVVVGKLPVYRSEFYWFMYLKIIFIKFDKLKTYSKTCVLHHDVQKNIHKKLPT